MDDARQAAARDATERAAESAADAYAAAAATRTIAAVRALGRGEAADASIERAEKAAGDLARRNSMCAAAEAEQAALYASAPARGDAPTRGALHCRCRHGGEGEGGGGRGANGDKSMRRAHARGAVKTSNPLFTSRLNMESKPAPQADAQVGRQGQNLQAERVDIGIDGGCVGWRRGSGPSSATVGRSAAADTDHAAGLAGGGRAAGRPRPRQPLRSPHMTIETVMSAGGRRTRGVMLIFPRCCGGPWGTGCARRLHTTAL